jgi:predicted lipoprotein with Yx(FWY)xxD motif
VPSKATAAPAKAATATTRTATVRVANSRLGRILVDSSGRTLYLFKADVGTKSACFGSCAIAWPPLRSGGKPAVRSGARASLVGTTKRSDGARQVTYDGHPLYLFINDHKPGNVTGQGVTAFGAAWFAVSPAGKQISSKPSGHGGGPPAPKPRPAPKPAPTPAPQPTPPPAANPAPPPSNGIPQNNGGDGDSDNNGGPSDGDGNV